ncbi:MULTISPECIES: hypothetical protein [Pseudomonas]|uniref:Uncharacterized protein n=1 Tax=Pseudomonas fluorescens LMG 5329 TaxID=1324332 RepID=A0A0A1Z3G0_PSEFL|nr:MULTISPECIES: hypothetical protein [Pseudomonas]KGE67616.1 hypothetical protein K814_0112510 [Pseudomonas fluorescens LMG 5329]NWE04801.1 hypothetical protein [Pseudomonas sp. IPO3749]NWF24564.1 hypothetical protein [Pseudomonas sp. IPO3749]
MRDHASSATAVVGRRTGFRYCSGHEESPFGLPDFLKAFFVRVKENTVREHSFIPNHFSISDNCAQDLDVDDLIDGDFVKVRRS